MDMKENSLKSQLLSKSKKLIASASPRYAAILKILSETGTMPHELSRISLRDIDLERGFLYVQACMHVETYLLSSRHLLR